MKRLPLIAKAAISLALTLFSCSVATAEDAAGQKGSVAQHAAGQDIRHSAVTATSSEGTVQRVEFVASRAGRGTSKAAPKIPANRTQQMRYEAKKAARHAGPARPAPTSSHTTDMTRGKNLSMEYVAATYRANGVDLSSLTGLRAPGIGDVYKLAAGNNRIYYDVKPNVGDLAFFHNTVDRDGDGRWNDWFTLVGIVESVESSDGMHTVTVLTWRTDRIERINLNVKYAELHRSRKGLLLNSQLRPDGDGNTGTAGKLFAGFANLLGNTDKVVVIDNWHPGMKIRKP